MIKNLKDVWALDVRSLDVATSSKQVISWGEKKEKSTTLSSSIREMRAQNKNTVPLRLERQTGEYKESQVTRTETSIGTSADGSVCKSLRAKSSRGHCHCGIPTIL